jgi:hypothetical protein
MIMRIAKLEHAPAIASVYVDTIITFINTPYLLYRVGIVPSEDKIKKTLLGISL